MVCPAIPGRARHEQNNLQSVTVRIKEDTDERPKAKPTKSEFILTQTAGPTARSVPRSREDDPGAPPTYPFLAYSSVKDRSRDTSAPAETGPTDDLL